MILIASCFVWTKKFNPSYIINLTGALNWAFRWFESLVYPLLLR